MVNNVCVFQFALIKKVVVKIQVCAIIAWRVSIKQMPVNVKQLPLIHVSLLVKNLMIWYIMRRLEEEFLLPWAYYFVFANELLISFKSVEERNLKKVQSLKTKM